MTDFTNPGWQAALNETLAEKLEGRLLAIYPGEEVQKEGEDGKMRTVRLCMVWDISSDTPEFIDHKAPFGWQVVRAQLAKSTPENPWIVGRLRKQNRAYLLDSPKVNEVGTISKSLTEIVGLIPLLELGATEVEEAF